MRLCSCPVHCDMSTYDIWFVQVMTSFVSRVSLCN
uniref:Uncharacterized protein n=1 Tax=Anguilla anguilla TaxID=7936 RepID=A0A0E9QU95_ANGAN